MPLNTDILADYVQLAIPPQTDPGVQDEGILIAVGDALVEVRNTSVEVFIDDVSTLSATVPGAPLGPGRVGVYAFDTDAGVFYDNFLVTQP